MHNDQQYVSEINGILYFEWVYVFIFRRNRKLIDSASQKMFDIYYGIRMWDIVIVKKRISRLEWFQGVLYL